MKEELNDYLHYLTIERGLSLNTRKSYERDLAQYLHFLEEKKITAWQDVDRFIVISYLEKMHDEKSTRDCHTDDHKFKKIPSILTPRTYY